MKLCDTCIYGDKYEFEKPCVLYSDDCKLYEEKKMDDMTRKRAISELNQIYGMLSPDKQRALDVAINSLKVDEQYDLMYEQAEPKAGHWIENNDDHYDWCECSECGYGAEGEITSERGVRFNYCPNCGADMVEPQESEGV